MKVGDIFFELKKIKKSRMILRQSFNLFGYGPECAAAISPMAQIPRNFYSGLGQIFKVIRKNKDGIKIISLVANNGQIFNADSHVLVLREFPQSLIKAKISLPDLR